MAKFNKTKTVVPQKTVNLAGSEAYKESSKLELISLLLTSFATSKFYEKEEKINERLIGLIEKKDMVLCLLMDMKIQQKKCLRKQKQHIQ
jgi:hypothetical protein